jgi:hypothetical protein
LNDLVFGGEDALLFGADDDAVDGDGEDAAASFGECCVDVVVLEGVYRTGSSR